MRRDHALLYRYIYIYNQSVDQCNKSDPVNPLPPQRFEICRITSTSISFSWTPPFHDGGGDILEYVLTYEEAVPVYKQCLGSKNDKVIRYKGAIISYICYNVVHNFLYSICRLQ